jgi:hypothetical protein
MKTFNIEVTDTFGGEANYSWVKRFTFKTSSVHGALILLGREYGRGWRKHWDNGTTIAYKVPGKCIICFVTEAEEVTA